MLLSVNWIFGKPKKEKDREAIDTGDNGGDLTPPTVDAGGCSVGGGRGTEHAAALLAMLLLLLALRPRRT